MTTHTFVVPAFGEPPWLERCIGSLQRQTVASRVVVTTSTPNPRISEVTQAMGVPLIVNPVSAGIASDWNFALQHAPSEWVSLAHQDDWYQDQYLESCLRSARAVRNPLMVFTAAHESFQPHGPLVANARVKRALCHLTFLTSTAIDAPYRKRLLLSFGNPVPCSSVMLNKARLPQFAFPEGWSSNLDWKAWLQLANAPGAFVYVSHPLVQRTLHANATTTLSMDAREREDIRVFKELWPQPLAWILSRMFVLSHKPYRQLRREQIS